MSERDTPTDLPRRDRRETVPCPVCEGTRHRVRFEPRVEVDDPKLLYGIDTGIRDAQRIVACVDCGMVYENPQLPAELIVSGYAAAAGAEHHSQYDLRVRTFASALSRLSRSLPRPGSRVLDVGAAGGAFVRAASDFGYDVTGLEPSAALAEEGLERGLDMRHGTLDDCELAPQSFDLITFWDVLEHLPTPRAALAAARSLLRTDGILLLNLPDFGTLSARLLGRRFWWYSSPHLSCFDRRSVRALFDRTGFQLERVARHWQTLQLGHLVRMAEYQGVPFARAIHANLPGAIAEIPVPYTASQTTFLGKPARS